MLLISLNTPERQNATGFDLKRTLGGWCQHVQKGWFAHGGFPGYPDGSELFREETMLKRFLPVLRLLSVVIALLGADGIPAFAESRYVAAGTAEQPANLGEVKGVMTFRGQTGEGPMKDAWFAFTLSNATRVRIAVDQPDVTFDLRLVGSRGGDGVLISTAFSREASIEYEVDAGTYLLRTYADTPSSYTATLKAN
ncbi:PPC domain-containing protein [Agrobacterium rhizogenes]|uniref:PPC domain-containing protein n=1 Tax=Rhizobium rhizogenes TaxID=359 RepID=UPI0022B6BF23|nr:PPC domain-containing protein [Rhizobium rhizogenes]MCZ7451024.1 PPC domain-containing protein [Rhizobium rhizogenes]